MDVTVRVIPHSQQRYPTVGDWQWIFDNLDIAVSDMEDWRYSFLVGFHEQIEAVLCRLRRVTQEQVDRFDMEYEKNRPEGDESEPGNDLNAPYHREHTFATMLEMLMCYEMGVDWEEYDKKVNSL